MFRQLSPFWLVVYFAIINVQFNILLFQLKDVTNQCPELKPRRWSRCIQKIEDGSKTYNPSEFCQEPPESSGRWECAVIHSSVHENSTISTNYSWSHHVLPSQPTQHNSSVLLRQWLLPLLWQKLLQSYHPRGRVPEDALKVLLSWIVNSTLFIVVIVSAFY